MSGRPAVNLTGRVFGRLVVLRRATSGAGSGADPDRHAWWQCSCVCGETWRVRGVDLTSGKTTSCGCWRVEASRGRMVEILRKRRRVAAALRRAA